MDYTCPCIAIRWWNPAARIAEHRSDCPDRPRSRWERFFALVRRNRR